LWLWTRESPRERHSRASGNPRVVGDVPCALAGLVEPFAFTWTWYQLLGLLKC
jgi:hypothetical protein